MCLLFLRVFVVKCMHITVGVSVCNGCHFVWIASLVVYPHMGVFVPEEQSTEASNEIPSCLLFFIRGSALRCVCLLDWVTNQPQRSSVALRALPSPFICAPSPPTPQSCCLSFSPSI